MELLISLTQQENQFPYRFPGTGIQVYSFEEVLYHVYHYWKQSVDDVVDSGLASWVHDSLGLSFLSARMKEISKIEKRIKRFQSIRKFWKMHD